MADSDQYISNLDPKDWSDVSEEWNFVVQQDNGGPNTTYRFTFNSLMDYIQNNTNYSEVYDFPLYSISDDTILSVGAGSPWTEVVRIKASNESVGIGTSAPTSKLEVFSSDNVNGDIMMNAENGERLGFHISASSGPSTPAKIHIGRRNQGDDASFVSIGTVDENGNVEFNITDNTATVINNGYTQLGDDAEAPQIKSKTFRGTTGATDGSEVSFLHNIGNISKIVSCSVLVENSVNSILIPPNDTITTDSYYSYRIGSGSVFITIGGDSNSSAIQATDYVCTILYEN